MSLTPDHNNRGGSGANDDAQPGCAEPGAEFNPAELPDDDSKPTGSREAPAPGVPVSDDEYDRLKDRARHKPQSDDGPAQEDTPKPS